MLFETLEQDEDRASLIVWNLEAAKRGAGGWPRVFERAQLLVQSQWLSQLSLQAQDRVLDWVLDSAHFLFEVGLSSSSSSSSSLVLHSSPLFPSLLFWSFILWAKPISLARATALRFIFDAFETAPRRRGRLGSAPICFVVAFASLKTISLLLLLPLLPLLRDEPRNTCLPEPSFFFFP